jgi:hypothetical protein
MCGGLLLFPLSCEFFPRPYPPGNTSVLPKWFCPDNDFSPLRSFPSCGRWIAPLFVVNSEFQSFRKNLTTTLLLSYDSFHIVVVVYWNICKMEFFPVSFESLVGNSIKNPRPWRR